MSGGHFTRHKNDSADRLTILEQAMSIRRFCQRQYARYHWAELERGHKVKNVMQILESRSFGANHAQVLMD